MSRGGSGAVVPAGGLGGGDDFGRGSASYFGVCVEFDEFDGVSECDGGGGCAEGGDEFGAEC